MSHLELRPGFIDTVKRLHGITSDEALAAAIGVGFRTLVRIKAHPEAIQSQAIAGFCSAFGYSPSDVVTVVTNEQQHALAA